MSVAKPEENKSERHRSHQVQDGVKPWWIDVRDVFAIAGISLLGYGFWLVSPALGCIVPGAVLTYVAIFGVRG